MSHNNIGVSLSATGKPAEALAAYEQARAIFERLAERTPPSPRSRATWPRATPTSAICSARPASPPRRWRPASRRGRSSSGWRGKPHRHRVPEQSGQQPQQTSAICCTEPASRPRRWRHTSRRGRSRSGWRGSIRNRQIMQATWARRSTTWRCSIWTPDVSPRPATGSVKRSPGRRRRWPPTHGIRPTASSWATTTGTCSCRPGLARRRAGRRGGEGLCRTGGERPAAPALDVRLAEVLGGSDPKDNAERLALAHAPMTQRRMRRHTVVGRGAETRPEARRGPPDSAPLQRRLRRRLGRAPERIRTIPSPMTRPGRSSAARPSAGSRPSWAAWDASTRRAPPDPVPRFATILRHWQPRYRPRRG